MGGELSCGDALVSVIMPVYNGRNYIEEAIKSVQFQTCENWELIVQDDVSEDGSDEIIRAYTDDRIKYERNHQRAGIAGNINRGIKRSRGVYISILCQDDRMFPNCLEKQVAHLDHNKNVGFSFCTAYKIDESGKRLERASHVWDEQYVRTPAVASPAEGLLLLLNYGCLPGNLSPLIIRRKCLDQVGLFKEDYVMPLDWDLCIRLTSQFGFGFLNERLLEIRRHSRQASKLKSNIYRNMKESFECLSMIKRDLLEYCPNRLYWRQKIEKGIARKYGESYMHSVLRCFFCGDIQQALRCANLLSRNIGLFTSALHWFAYLPSRIQRRLLKHGQDHMSTVLNDSDFNFLQAHIKRISE